MTAGILVTAQYEGSVIGVKFGEAFLRSSVTPRAELEL
jgi:hypothetical protein